MIQGVLGGGVTGGTACGGGGGGDKGEGLRGVTGKHCWRTGEEGLRLPSQLLALHVYNMLTVSTISRPPTCGRLRLQTTRLQTAFTCAQLNTIPPGTLQCSAAQHTQCYPCSSSPLLFPGSVARHARCRAAQRRQCSAVLSTVQYSTAQCHAT